MLGSLSPRMSEDVSTYLTEAFQEQPGMEVDDIQGLQNLNKDTTDKD